MVLAVLVVLGALAVHAAIVSGEWAGAPLGLCWVEEGLSGATWVPTGSISGAPGQGSGLHVSLWSLPLHPDKAGSCPADPMCLSPQD